jgi:hypothetical protein
MKQIQLKRKLKYHLILISGLIFTQSILVAQSVNFIGAKKSEIVTHFKEDQSYESPTLMFQTGLKYVKCSSLDGMQVYAFYLDENDICYKQITMYKSFNDYRTMKKDLDNKFARLGRDMWSDIDNTKLLYTLDKRKSFYALHIQKFGTTSNDICLR